MRIIPIKQVKHKKQQGAVLFIAMIMLLVITIVGVTAVNSAGIKTQVAGNSMFSMLVYQGAESALAKSSDLSNLFSSMPFKNNPMDIPVSLFPAENITAGATLNSKGTVTYEGDRRLCPVTGGLPSSDKFTCHIYRVRVESRIQATNARDIHIKGIAMKDSNPLK